MQNLQVKFSLFYKNTLHIHSNLHFKQGSVKVKPFIEWQATRTKYENTFDKDSGKQLDRSRDFKTVIGLRAYW